MRGRGGRHQQRHRDSDASSLCSSRSNTNPPSAALITERPAQTAALKSINAYLSSCSASCSLKPPLPSAREINEALRFLLSRLDYPIPTNSPLDEELLLFLKLLNCPLKIVRSALKNPGTPYSWATFVSVLIWLVDLARYADNARSSSSSSDNDLLSYVSRSYSYFIAGDDDSVEQLDQEYLAKAQHQLDSTAVSVDALAVETDLLEKKLSDLRSLPSKKEVLLKEKAVLEEDVSKFRSVVENWDKRVEGMKEKEGEMEKALEEKEAASRRLCEENEGLRRRVEGQVVGVRDVKRIRKETQAVERDAAEAEVGRNAMEEKAWELQTEIGRKLKDLEAVANECNQAMTK